MAAAPQKPIDLYYWPTPNGWKITIMLEECGLPYAVHPINIGKGDQFKPDFLEISPNNKMPAIVDPDGPDGKPVSVFESGAILQYLGRKTGRFYPADERRRIEVDQWLFWQMGGFGPMLGQTHHFRIYAPEKIGYAIDRYTNETNRLYGVLNKQLADREYRRRGLFDRRYGHRSLGQIVGAAGPEHRGLPAREALARCGDGPPGGRARPQCELGGSRQDRPDGPGSPSGPLRAAGAVVRIRAGAGPMNAPPRPPTGRDPNSLWSRSVTGR